MECKTTAADNIAPVPSIVTITDTFIHPFIHLYRCFHLPN